MKEFLLTLKRIYELVINEKVLFGVFLLSIIVTITSFIYFYGFYNGIKTRNEKSDLKTKTIEITSGKQEDYHEIISALKAKSYMGFKEIKLISFQKTKQDKPYQIVSYMPKNHTSLIYQGRYFNEAELNGEVHSLIIGSDLIDPSNKADIIGSSYMIDKMQYTIVGLVDLSNSNSLEISYLDFLKNNYRIDRMSILAGAKVDYDTICKLESCLNVINPDITMTLPPKVNKDILYTYVSNMTFVIMVISLAVINLLFLFNYMVEKRKREYVVMKICGASTRTVIASIFTELVMIIFLGYSISLLTAALLSSAVSNITTVKPVCSIGDFILILMTVLLISFMAFFPAVIKIAGESPVALKNNLLE